MKSKSSPISINSWKYLPAIFTTAGVLSAIGAVAYAFAYRNSYDPMIHHYARGSRLITISAVLLFASLICAILPSVKMRKKYSLADCPPNSAETFTLWLTALMFVGFGLFSLTEGYSADTSSTVGRMCSILEAPVSILSALPLICAASEKLRCGTVHRISSFFPAIWGICQIFKYYFDLSEIPLNDPELAITVTVISSTVLFFLTEIRSAMLINSPALCSFSALSAVCFSGMLSCARIILYFTDSLAFPSIMENVVFLCIALLALARLCTVPSRIIEKAAEDGSDKSKNGGKNQK